VDNRNQVENFIFTAVNTAAASDVICEKISTYAYLPGNFYPGLSHLQIVTPALWRDEFKMTSMETLLLVAALSARAAAATPAWPDLAFGPQQMPPGPHGAPRPAAAAVPLQPSNG
jgi:hypothetical protein